MVNWEGRFFDIKCSSGVRCADAPSLKLRRTKCADVPWFIVHGGTH